MERPFKQSDPRATFREVFFTCVDAAAVTTPLQSSDMSSFVVYLIKNAVAPAVITPTITQLDATNAKGWFRMDLAAANIDTPGNIGLSITNTGGTKTMLRRELWFAVDPAFMGTAITGTLSTSTFTTDRTEATDNYWKDTFVEFLTGSLAGQVKKVGGYTGSTKLFTLATGLLYTAAPANGDVFEIINR